MKSAFMTLDWQLKEDQAMWGDNSGSTAVCVLVKNNTIYCVSFPQLNYYFKYSFVIYLFLDVFKLLKYLSIVVNQKINSTLLIELNQFKSNKFLILN